MESSLSSIYATTLPKSPSMITTKRTTSTNFLQVNNCSHIKTRNGNLMNKLQKSLNNFIKHHKTTITLSGSKRFSDKSGIYYLKNSNHKCNLNDNYLTPIPSIKKINSHYEKNSLNKAERTAVYLRRMEYSSCIKNNKRIDKMNKIKSHINNASFILYHTLKEMSPFDKGDTNIDTFFIPRYNEQDQCDLYIFQNPYKKTDTVNNNNFKIIIFTSASYSKDDITNNITYISTQLQSLYSIVDLSQAIVSIISFPSFISTYETQLLSLKICLTGIKSINIDWYINSLVNTPIDSGYLAEIKSTLYPELHHMAMSYYEKTHSSNVTPVKQGTIKEIPISYNKSKHKSISPPIYSRKIPQMSSVRNKNDKERNTAMIYQRANIEFKPYKKKIIKGGELSTNNTTLNATMITNEIKEVRIPLPCSNRKNYSRKHSDDFNSNHASNMSFAEPSNHLMLNSTDLNISSLLH